MPLAACTILRAIDALAEAIPTQLLTLTETQKALGVPPLLVWRAGLVQTAVRLVSADDLTQTKHLSHATLFDQLEKNCRSGNSQLQWSPTLLPGNLDEQKQIESLVLEKCRELEQLADQVALELVEEDEQQQRAKVKKRPAKRNQKSDRQSETRVVLEYEDRQLPTEDESDSGPEEGAFWRGRSTNNQTERNNSPDRVGDPTELPPQRAAATCDTDLTSSSSSLWIPVERKRDRNLSSNSSKVPLQNVDEVEGSISRSVPDDDNTSAAFSFRTKTLPSISKHTNASSSIVLDELSTKTHKQSSCTVDNTDENTTNAAALSKSNTLLHRDEDVQRMKQDYEEQIQALQLRLYICETQLGIYKQAYDDHVSTIHNNSV